MQVIVRLLYPAALRLDHLHISHYVSRSRRGDL
jgi:hypothetical protein